MPNEPTRQDFRDDRGAGRNQPKPFRVHLRKLRIRLEILYRRLAAYIIVSIAVSGAVTLVLAMFELENQTVPLLTGLFQIGVAAALGWEQIQFELGD
jgi:hypothetical protein